MFRTIGLIIGFLCCSIPALARIAAPPIRELVHADSLERRQIIQVTGAEDTLATHVTKRNRQLYDSIATRSHRSKFSKFLYEMLFVDPEDNIKEGEVVDESKLYEPYRGKVIQSISIKRQKIFSNEEGSLEKMGNSLHVQTRERIIRRDLLFKEGDKVNPELITRTQQLLRSRAYIYTTRVHVVIDSLDSTRVNLQLETRDSWTISLSFGLKSENRMFFGIVDDNILGTGNQLKLKTHFDRKEFVYGGNSVEYEMPNLFGSFFSSYIEGGKSFFERTFRWAIKKEFLKPNDYELGFSMSNVRRKYLMIEKDSLELAKRRNYDVWVGLSRRIPSINSSVFLAARYNYSRFGERPKVYYQYNPSFHNHDHVLVGAGLYRERFLATNMIYGFGKKEYMATGYKAEVVTGYSWGEFADELYLGMSYKTGSFKPSGYYSGQITLGSYIDYGSGKWNRGAVDVRMIWFSNLYHSRRSRFRQIIGLSYTQGWNRTRGNNESIRFTRERGLRALDEYQIGTTRMVLNTETIIFTPIQPLGFRFAFFGFADFGLLGYHANVFKNNFFSTLGLGLRIKNERLIFNEIQIRLGIAFGKHGLQECEYFRLSDSPRQQQIRYRPEQPQVLPFR